MSARLAVAGSVLTGLVVVGGFAAMSAFQPVPVRQSVDLIQPAVESVPVVTIAPDVAPTTLAPAPVVSVKAPIVVAPRKVAPVAAVPAAEPTVAQPDTYPRDADGNLTYLPPIPADGPQIDGHGVPIPTPSK